MNLGIGLLILLIILILIIFLVKVAWKTIILHHRKKNRHQQSDHIRFLQVKIPNKAVSKSQDIEATDHIKEMNDNIEIMNQIYKNIYSIFEETRRHRSGYKKYIYNIRKTILGNNIISMELSIERENIKFIIGVHKDQLETIEKMISAFYVGSIVDPISQPKLLDAGKYMAGGEFCLIKDSVYPLKTYESFEADPMDSILSAYNNVNKNEKMTIQILTQPLHEGWLKKIRKKSKKLTNGTNYSLIKTIFLGFSKIFSGNKDSEKSENDKQEKKHEHDYSQNQEGDIDKKSEDEMFLIKMRVLAVSSDKQRAIKLAEDLAKLFSQYNYVGLNGIKYKKAGNIKRFAKTFVSRTFFSDEGWYKNVKNYKKKYILSIKELSSMYHFPHTRFNQNPRISWQNSKIVPATDTLPTDGLLIGWNMYGGVKKEIRLTPNDRFRHVYVLGQTGSGKTTLLKTMAIQDLAKGNSFCYIDPHGEDVDFLLNYFPKERIDDLIYFDLSNTEYPLAFNPLDGAESEDERDVITNDMVEMFVSLYGHEIFGPRIQDYFRNACFLLMEQPEGGTLIDIMRLFTDDAYAESKIRNVKNPVIAARWNKTYRKMGDREKAEIIPFIQAKFGPFTTGVYVRNVIGQPKSAFNMYDAMQEGKIILCKLAKGLAGEINSQLIGRMLTMQIKLAALKRAKIPPEERKPYFLYVDEFQNYVSESFESILSEARKYKVGLAIAHQYIDQLKKEGLGGNLDLSKTIFGNIGNMFIGKVGAPDAEFLEKEMAPEFTQSDLINTEMFNGACKISIAGSQSRPFSYSTKRPWEEPQLNSKEKVAIMKQISALKRGTKRELVDKEVYFRVGV